MADFSRASRALDQASLPLNSSELRDLSQHSFLLSLPDEDLVEIMRHMKSKSLARLCKVNARMRGLCNERDLREKLETKPKRIEKKLEILAMAWAISAFIGPRKQGFATFWGGNETWLGRASQFYDGSIVLIQNVRGDKRTSSRKASDLLESMSSEPLRVSSADEIPVKDAKEWVERGYFGQAGISSTIDMDKLIGWMKASKKNKDTIIREIKEFDVISP